MPEPGYVIDNGQERKIEGFTKSGRGYSLLIRMNPLEEEVSKCDMVAAGLYPKNALECYRALSSSCEVRPLGSARSREDLNLLRKQGTLYDFTCELLAKQRGTAARVVVLGRLSNDHERIQRQYWQTNLKRSFPTQVAAWIHEIWKGAPSPHSQRDRSPVSSVSDVATGPRSLEASLLQNLAMHRNVRLSTRTNLRQPSQLPGATMVEDEQTVENPPAERICPPCFDCLPQEILDLILDHSIDTDLPNGSSETPELTPGCDFFALLNVSKRLNRAAIALLSRQEFVVHVSAWPCSTEKPFIQSFPANLLRQMRRVRFDFSGSSYEELRDEHPCIRQLSRVWSQHHRLKSISMFVPPDLSPLLRKPPRLLPIPQIVQSCAALVEEFGDIIEWDPRDIDGPCMGNFSALLTIVRLKDRGGLLRFMLSESKGVLDRNHGMNGDTVLHYATRSTDTEHLRLLIHAVGLGVNRTNYFGKTALVEAVIDQNEEMVRVFLSEGIEGGKVRGLDVEIPDNLGNTALMHAVAIKHESIIELLLSKGQANLGLRGSDGKTALEIAEKRGYKSIAQLLRRYIV